MANAYIKDLSVNAAPDVGDAVEIDDGTNSEYILMPAHSRWLPQSMLVNGQISVSVSSNNITAALKGLNGSDPSATNPVYVRIGNTYRIVTAALSVTAAAATNWFNAGGAELATQLINYFVYLGYNATDGVVIGFARFPFARKYSDFNTTSTNEKYCRISTITNAAASDEYENVGRFSATLSAGAGYTWSISGTGDVINRPSYETDLLDWTPAWSANASMTYTSVSTTIAKYQVTGRRCKVFTRASGTIGGTPSTTVLATLPFESSLIATAAEQGAGTGDTVFGRAFISAGTPDQVSIQRYDAGNWTAGTRIAAAEIEYWI